MSHPIHRLALESEELFYCDGIWVCSNSVFGILFKDKWGDFVFNRALCLQGGF